MVAWESVQSLAVSLARIRIFMSAPSFHTSDTASIAGIDDYFRCFVNNDNAISATFSVLGSCSCFRILLLIPVLSLKVK